MEHENKSFSLADIHTGYYVFSAPWEEQFWGYLLM